RITWNDDDDVLDVLGLDSRYKAKKGAGSRPAEPSSRPAGHQRASSRPAGLGRIAWNDDDYVLDVLGLDSRYKAKKGAGSRPAEPSSHPAGHQWAFSRPASHQRAFSRPAGPLASRLGWV
ncbi:hypothetical protein Tco_1352401, partial [Tanacetum coccineum]